MSKPIGIRRTGAIPSLHRYSINLTSEEYAPYQSILPINSVKTVTNMTDPEQNEKFSIRCIRAKEGYEIQFGLIPTSSDHIEFSGSAYAMID